jgi:hypothetical protein
MIIGMEMPGKTTPHLASFINILYIGGFGKSDHGMVLADNYF